MPSELQQAIEDMNSAPTEAERLAAYEKVRRLTLRGLSRQAMGDHEPEPWQLTLDDYRETLRGKRVDRGSYYNREGQIQRDHRASISAALQMGRPVPACVLKDYPYMPPHGSQYY